MTGFPTLRMGVLECGFGWLPFWARRMDEQAVYVGGVAPLKHTPSEYMASGRFFCSIEHHEGEDMFSHVTQFLGDDVLMYASDYPHSECQFPDSVDNILAWENSEARYEEKAAVGQREPVLQRDLVAPFCLRRPCLSSITPETGVQKADEPAVA